MRKMLLWWGAPLLAGALPFGVAWLRGGDVAMLADDAHGWTPWVLLVAAVVGGFAPWMWRTREGAIAWVRRAACWTWALAALACAVGLLINGDEWWQWSGMQELWTGLLLALCIAVAVCSDDGGGIAEGVEAEQLRAGYRRTRADDETETEADGAGDE